jgi:hypothetical protein
VKEGRVTRVIRKRVLMLNRLEAELMGIAGGVAGVESIRTKAGRQACRWDIYWRYDAGI